MTRKVMPPLNPLRVFVVAAQRGSFSSAAKALGVSQANVSRQVTVLEDFLGVKLFDRSGRDIRLTDVGRLYVNRTGPCFDIISSATEEVLGKERDTTINLTAYPTFSFKWLIPRLSDFERRHPEFNVRIHTAIRPVDFSSSEFDVAIQMQTGKSREAESVKIMDDEIDVVCSPKILKSDNLKLSIDDLSELRLLHSKYRLDDWEYWLKNALGIKPTAEPKYIYDSSILLYQAACEGVGLAIGQVALLADDFESGRLCRPFNKPVKRPQSYHILWPKDRHVRIKTRRFVDWVLSSTNNEKVFFPNEK